MDKNILMALCTCIGMVLGVAAGWMISASQGNMGTTMCYGLVFGMLLGSGVGTAISHFKGKD